MLLLWLPAFEMATGFVDVQQIEENRRRAAFPAPQELIHPIAFVRGVQLWFEDNYGFRDLLIRTKTQIDYSLFGVTSRVYVGHDGWLFFRSVIDHQEPQDEQLTDADLDQIIGNFAHLRDFLAVRGIRLIVITNELKDHFYPEQLPAWAAFAKRRHRFDDFRARMHALPGIIYIDPTPILTTVQRQRPIFHKTDFHWNDPAAFEVAKIL